MMDVSSKLQVIFDELAEKQMGIATSSPDDKVDRVYKGQMEAILDKEYDFKKSYEKCESIRGDREPIPWMTYSAIYYLDQLDLNCSSVFEWGGGNSSLYFAKRASTVVTVESSLDWFNYVDANKESNQTVYFETSTNYARCIGNLGSKYSIISIDGDIYRRLECAYYAINHLEEGGIIIINNSDWLKGTCEFLRSEGFTQLDFSGPGPINGYLWCTSVFFKNAISLISQSKDQPSYLKSGLMNQRDVSIKEIVNAERSQDDFRAAQEFHKNYKQIKRSYFPAYTDVFSSQEGEDILLKRLLKWHYQSPGFYVDVGAHDPIRFSNTYHYYLNGWRGINIDPRPGIMKKFDIVRACDTNLELGIAPESGTLDYFEFKEAAFNTFCEDSLAYAKTRTELLTVSKVKVEPLAYILDKYLPAGREITFLNVDVEGLECEVLSSSNWFKYRPKIVCVEALDSTQLARLDAFFTPLNYCRVASTKNSFFYCEELFWKEVK